MLDNARKQMQQVNSNMRKSAIKWANSICAFETAVNASKIGIAMYTTQKMGQCNLRHIPTRRSYPSIPRRRSQQRTPIGIQQNNKPNTAVLNLCLHLLANQSFPAHSPLFRHARESGTGLRSRRRVAAMRREIGRLTCQDPDILRAMSLGFCSWINGVSETRH